MPKRIMLVDSSVERAQWLAEPLREQGFHVCAVVPDTRQLYERVIEEEPDVVIVDFLSPQRDTLEHLSGLNQDFPKPILMFARETDSDTLAAAAKAGVSLFAVSCLPLEALDAIIETTTAQFREFQRLRGELAQTRDELDMRNLLERAKLKLMERDGLTEDQAYRSIRKAAMDANLKIGEIARGILSPGGSPPTGA